MGEDAPFLKRFSHTGAGAPDAPRRMPLPAPPARRFPHSPASSKFHNRNARPGNARKAAPRESLLANCRLFAETLTVKRLSIPTIVLCVLSSGILPAAFAADAGKATKNATKETTVKEVTPDEAERLLKLTPGVVILDVRTSEEFAEGHIPGAQNLNFFSQDFLEKAKALEGKTLLLHCASGGRSSQALERLKDIPLSAVYHLKKGFVAWQGAGKKVER